MSHKVLHISIALACVSFLTTLASAQDDVRRAGIAAATDSAVASLVGQIEPEPVAGQLTVKQFLDQTNAQDEFRAALARVEPMGGPRWLDDQTCQVRLQVSGTEVIVDLANIAVAHKQTAPIAAAILPQVAAGLSTRWFAATGTSTAAGVAPPPPMDNPWAIVTAAERTRAVQAADADAGQTVLVSVADLDLLPGHKLAEAIHDAAVAQALTGWLASRPVTAVEYGQNAQKELEVRVTVAASPAEFFDILKAAITARAVLPQPDEVGWSVLRQQVVTRMALPVGHATAAVAPAAALPVVLPAQPPDWARTMADAQGVSGPVPGNPRGAKGVAIDHAMVQLTSQVMGLRLSADLTFDQAAGRDRHIARVVDRTIQGSAVLYRTVYNPDGSVVVHMSLDLHLLWNALQARP